MLHVNMIESLKGFAAQPGAAVKVTERRGDRYASYEVFLATTVHKSPQRVLFTVPPGSIVLSIRHEGFSLHKSMKLGETFLAQPGSVFVYTEGDYLLQFSKGLYRGLIIHTTREDLRAVDSISSFLTERIPHLIIDPSADPLRDLISAVSTDPNQVTFFKVSTLFTGLLDRLYENRNNRNAPEVLGCSDLRFGALCHQINEHPEVDWTIDRAAHESGYSTFHFSRKFRETTGMGLPQYMNLVRSTRLAHLICSENLGAVDASRVVGFSSRESANRLVAKCLGLTPHDIEVTKRFTSKDLRLKMA